MYCQQLYIIYMGTYAENIVTTIDAKSKQSSDLSNMEECDYGWNIGLEIW